MERKILFKAKKLSDGTWAEGDLYHNVRGFECCIGQQEKDDVYVYPVDSSTVCQFTGLKDKNGKPIWEHDLINYQLSKYEIIFIDGSFSYINRYGVKFPLIYCDMELVNNIVSKFDRKEGEK